MKIILLGAPGSGKGTISNIICNEYNLMHISTGDLFRAQLKIDDDLTAQIKEFVLTGKYVPDWITNKIASDAIENSLSNYNGYILDGYPRTLSQVDYLNENYGQVDAAILLNVSNDTLIKRISGRHVCKNCNSIYNIYFFNKPKNESICDKCGGELIQRKDDALDVVQERITIYDEQTKPLIKYYQEKNLLYDINAEIEIGALVEKVRAILNKFR